MAELTVNGEKSHFTDGLSISGLLKVMGVSGRWVAVELNGMIVDRAAFDATGLCDGDVVEVIRPIGGG